MKDKKLDEQQKKIADKESALFLTLQENTRLKSRNITLKNKLDAFSQRGSMKSICSQLNKAAEDKQLNDKSVFKGLLESCAKNFHRKKNGKRYHENVKNFYETLMH